MKVKLNNKFYRKEAVEESLRDFKGVLKGKILNDDFLIELEPEKDVDRLKEEFCNYVLGLMKNNMLI